MSNTTMPQARKKLLVFCEQDTPALRRYLLREAFREYQQIDCYSTSMTRPKKLRSTIMLRPLGQSEGAETVAMYKVGREIADTLIADIKTQMPAFFQDSSGSGFDYERFILFCLHFDISRQRLNYLQACLSILAQLENSQYEVVFFNSLFLSPAILPLLSKYFPLLASCNCRTIHRLPQGWHPKMLSRIALFKAKYMFKRSFFPGKKTAFKPNGTLTLARGRHHLELLRHSLDVLPQEQPLYFLNLFHKKYTRQDSQLPQPLLEKLGLADRMPVLNLRSFYPSRDYLAQYARFFEARAGQVNALKDSNEDESRQAYYGQMLDTCFLLLKQFLRMEAIIRQVAPKMVVACLEKDSFSLILQELQKRHPFELINYQHGIMAKTYSLDLFEYDQFMLWNDLTRTVVLNDGYQRPQTLHVIGNPLWKKADASQPGHQENPALVKALLDWKASGKLIVAYTQTQNNYLTSSRKKAFAEALCGYLHARPGVQLLVKNHPNEFDSITEDVIKAAGLADRARVFKAHELSLLDSFALGDLSTSICSTVLLESQFYDVPALALDFDSIIPSLGYGIETLVPAVTNRADAFRKLDEMLDSNRDVVKSDLSILFPRFDEPYARRVRLILSGQ